MSASTDWKKIFEKLARQMRKEFSRRFPFKDDGDVSPELLSIRDGIHAFPLPVHVLRLDMRGAKNQFSEADTWTIVRYDISQKNTNQPQFHGAIAINDIANHYSLLETVFDIPEPAKLFKDLRPTSIWDLGTDTFLTEVVPYDIENRLAQYAEEFHRFLVDNLSLFFRQKFSRVINFNEKYGLVPDPILDPSRRLQVHPITSMFVKLSDGTPLTLEERQEEVASAQLIPQVPESVQRTFSLAKSLYVFGHFEYGFFTVAEHYAYLALEAAVHCRWAMMLSKPAKLTFGDAIDIPNPSYWGVSRHLRSIPRKPLLNGEPFPQSTPEVLQALLKKQIITKWELSRLQIGIYLRNSLSHLEFAPVHSPDSSTLYWVADLINQMFDSVAKSQSVAAQAATAVTQSSQPSP
jgi:hypothetical protein